MRWLAYCVALVFLVIWTAEFRFYRSIMPEKIELGAFYWHDGETNFFGGCGATIFSISARTAAAIEEQGIAFFDGVDRSVSGNRNYRKPWREVGTANRYDAGPHSFGLDCARRNAWYFPHLATVYDAMQRGKYFENGKFMIFPKERLIALSYWE